MILFKSNSGIFKLFRLQVLVYRFPYFSLYFFALLWQPNFGYLLEIDYFTCVTLRSNSDHVDYKKRLKLGVVEFLIPQSSEARIVSHS